VGVVVVGVVVVVVVAPEAFYVSPDLRMSELRKSGSVCTCFATTESNCAPSIFMKQLSQSSSSFFFLFLCFLLLFPPLVHSLFVYFFIFPSLLSSFRLVFFVIP
jgi:hypothetical protein